MFNHDNLPSNCQTNFKLKTSFETTKHTLLFYHLITI